MKDINLEINRLLSIKEDIHRIELFKQNCIFDIDILSKQKYDEFARNSLIEENKLYYIIDQEVGQYIEGYIG